LINKIKRNVLKNDSAITVLVFSFFFAWLLSFAFEGEIFYALADSFGNISIRLIAFGPMIAHLIGILVSGFLINTIRLARHMMLYSITFCIITSSLIFINQPVIWIIAILFSSFLSGICVAAWSFFLKKSTPKGKRIKTVADGLIGANVLMIIINLSVIKSSVYIGIGVSIFSLFVALVFSMFLNVEEDYRAKEITNSSIKNLEISNNTIPFGLRTEGIISINKNQTGIDSNRNILSDNKQLNLSSGKKPRVNPILILVIFILVITINSGLMYRVLIPSFSHLKSFTGWYWALPYIVAIFIIRNLSVKIKRSYIIYVAMSMMGLSFIAFYLLGKSTFEYIIINTLMLGAFGIIDIFWWSTLGEMLELYKNPAKIFGIGLSANVFGVITGGIIGEYIYSNGNLSDFKTMIIALFVICVTLIIFFKANKTLSIVNENPK